MLSDGAMRKSLLALAALLLPSQAAADTLIFNANGIQVDDYGHLARFSGLVIGDDGKIARLVRADEPSPTARTRIDAHGQTLLPGLIDAHGHVVESSGGDIGLGLMLLQLDLNGTASVEDLKQRLRSYAAANPGSGWIRGRGWNQELWSDKRFPTSADLDAVVSDRPVLLTRVDGHAAVGNSVALKTAGITASTRDPQGGRIERDSNGRPTGLLIDNAVDIVMATIPRPSPRELDEALAKAQQVLLSFGVTAVGAMSTPLSSWEAMRRAGAAGRLNVRFIVYADQLGSLKSVPRPTAWLYGDRLRMVGLKFYADGALGSRGAWLKQRYADKPDTRGLQFHPDAELLSLADTAASHGFQVAIHAIGDAANAQVISIYEQLSRKHGRDRRWRIEHFQIVDPADIPRLAPAGIIASMQPTHQTSDRLMAEARLGPNRLAGAYAWQTVLKSGARLAFGTDFPVESPNPFPGLSAAISRQDVNGQPPGGWMPSERLTFEQALDAYTRGAAYAGFAEDKIGSLAPGKWADFVFVDRDPTSVDAQSLARTKVLETWVGGKKVWSRAPSAAGRPERGK
jgi:predicted amidohydrolase YtcJ